MRTADPGLIDHGAAARACAMLTPRQRQALMMAAQGFTAREAAARLGLFRKTLQSYAEEARQVLACRNLTQAVAIAVRGGIL